MMQSFLLYSPKIVFDLFLDILYFLPWWYTKGLVQVIVKSWEFIIKKEEQLAIMAWIKNIHQPLFEKYSWQGIIKSVIVRLLQIIWRTLILAFWLVIIIAGLILYLILPVLAIWQIFYQLYF